MINLIFYLIIGTGIGYFIYLFYRKWPFLSRKEIENIDELSMFKPKRPQSFSRINRKLQRAKLKLFSKKILFLKKEDNRFIGKLKTKAAWLCLVGRRSFLEKTRFLQGLYSSVIRRVRSFTMSFQKHLIGIKETKHMKFFGRLAKIKYYFQKAKNKFSLQRAKLVFKAFRSKTKIALHRQQDREIKRRLQEHKDSIVKPEFYLGELLKRIPGKRRERKKREEKRSFELRKEEAEKEYRQKQEKLASLGLKRTKEEWKSLPLKYSFSKEQEETNSQIKISEESIKKIESQLISEILEDPKNIEAYKKLGKLYYNQFRYDYAKESFEAALKLGSGDKRIKELLEECNRKLGKGRK